MFTFIYKYYYYSKFGILLKKAVFKRKREEKA